MALIGSHAIFQNNQFTSAFSFVRIDPFIQCLILNLILDSILFLFFIQLINLVCEHGLISQHYIRNSCPWRKSQNADDLAAMLNNRITHIISIVLCSKVQSKGYYGITINITEAIFNIKLSICQLG